MAACEGMYSIPHKLLQTMRLDTPKETCLWQELPKIDAVKEQEAAATRDFEGPESPAEPRSNKLSLIPESLGFVFLTSLYVVRGCGGCGVSFASVSAKLLSAATRFDGLRNSNSARRNGAVVAF
jgi:hypothetical protein